MYIYLYIYLSSRRMPSVTGAAAECRQLPVPRRIAVGCRRITGSIAGPVLVGQNPLRVASHLHS